MNKQVIFSAIVITVLFINGWEDLKSRSCFAILFTGAAAAGIFLSGHPVISILALLSSLFMPDIKGIGGGDTDAFLLVLAAAYQESLMVYGISLIIGILYCLVKKKKSIPFIAMLAAGYAVYILLKLFNFI